MNEKEKQSFRLVFEFLEKWRGTVIETEEQWAQLAEDTGKLGRDLDIDNNPLGWRLMIVSIVTLSRMTCPAILMFKSHPSRNSRQAWASSRSGTGR